MGGDVMPAREGSVRRRRVNGHSSRARQPADLGGGGGAGGQRAGSARDRAAGRRGLILATLATSNGSRDDSLAEPVDLIG